MNKKNSTYYNLFTYYNDKTQSFDKSRIQKALIDIKNNNHKFMILGCPNKLIGVPRLYYDNNQKRFVITYVNCKYPKKHNTETHHLLCDFKFYNIKLKLLFITSLYNDQFTIHHKDNEWLEFTVKD